MEKAIIVPARLGSQRFPRKLLHPVKGRPLILHTAERLREVAPDYPLYFAVAEQELADVLGTEGFQSVLTDPDLPSGTDRLAAANETLGAKTVINVQADEPLVTSGHIDTLAAVLAQGVDIATLAMRFEKADDFADTSKVKVVTGANGRALYFSRAQIPHDRDRQTPVDDTWLAIHPCHWHIGLYAYTADFLQAFRSLPEGALEKLEKLEQLRALENGYSIGVGIVKERTLGIDTPEDARLLEKRFH